MNQNEIFKFIDSFSLPDSVCISIEESLCNYLR